MLRDSRPASLSESSLDKSNRPVNAESRGGYVCLLCVFGDDDNLTWQRGQQAVPAHLGRCAAIWGGAQDSRRVHQMRFARPSLLCCVFVCVGIWFVWKDLQDSV